MNSRLAPLPLFLVLLAACAPVMTSPGASPTEPASETPSASPSPSASASAEASEDVGGNGVALPEAPAGIPDDVWAAVVADLVGRIDGHVADLTVVSATAQTWTDGSLGCPAPGQMYTQALVEGYHIVLEVDDVEYDYRTGSTGDTVRLCVEPVQGG
jgi:hypothetical protein